MSWFSSWGLPNYPYFTHGEYLSKQVLESRNYPSFITESIKELSDRHFYWLNSKDPHTHFEYEVIGFGLEVPGVPSEQFIMYISNSYIHLYHYKLDIEDEISRNKIQLSKLHKERSDVMKRMKSPNYITDEESRNKVLEQAQSGLDELREEWDNFNNWEPTFENGWYRRLYDEPIQLMEDDDVNTIIEVGRVLLELAQVEWGTSQISMIGISN